MPGLADTATEPLPFSVDPFLPAHEDPYPLYRYLRDAHPVLRAPEEELSRWIKPPLEPGVSLCVVSRYDDVEAIVEAFPDYAVAEPIRRPRSQAMRAIVDLPASLG